jgi:hypothetical protein
MSKKKRSAARRRSDAIRQAVQTSEAVVPQPTVAKKGFDPDYSYVIKDLRRIGILAGSFIALLIVLSFFLR